MEGEGDLESSISIVNMVGVQLRSLERSVPPSWPRATGICSTWWGRLTLLGMAERFVLTGSLLPRRASV